MLVRVPDNKASIRLHVKNNNATGYGNRIVAKAYLNGRRVQSLDCAKPNPAWKEGMPAKEKTLWDTGHQIFSMPLPTRGEARKACKDGE